MTKLRVGPELELPPKVVTEKLGFLGRTGSGKSYAAMKLAEEMSAAAAQFVALDPVGIWWGLRLAADGKAPGVLLPVFGGLHGDVPLEPGTGALIADLIVDRGISCVIDVSHFESDADKARFAEAWASRFYFRKKSSPSAVHVFIEEAQEFVPENSMRGEERMLHAFTRLQKLGRNFGIGTSLISQRPQEVNKKALNMTELLFAFQMTGPQERKTMKGWVSEKGIDEDIAAILPKLGVGTAHVWSPSWLQISETVKIGQRWTFDASSTPKVGTTAIVKELAPIDLEQLRTSMAATIEKAKAEDPKLLRAQIAELEKAAKAANTQRIAEKPIVDQDAIERAVLIALREQRQAFDVALKKQRWADDRKQREHRLELRRMADGIITRIGEINDLPMPPAEIETVVESRAVVQIGNEKKGTGANRPPVPMAGRSSRAPASPVITFDDDASLVDVVSSLSPSEEKILNALAAFETLGIVPTKRLNVAFFAGYSEGGRFNNLVSGLRTKGLIDYPTDGALELTDHGRALADGDAHRIRSRQDLLEMWLGKLPPSERKILLQVVEVYPRAITREHLAESTGYTEGGRFNNLVSRLRTLGVIDYPSKGDVIAGDVLYPPGLA